MARGGLTCDVCGKPCERIIGKLLLLPSKEGATWRHNDYKAHADVGGCCAGPVKTLVKWQVRKPRKGASNNGRRPAPDAVETSA